MTVALCGRVSSVDSRLVDTAIVAQICFKFKSSFCSVIRLGRDQSSSLESRSAISTKSDVASSTADYAVVAVPSATSCDALTVRAGFRRQRRFAHGVRSVPVMDTDLTSSLTRASLTSIASVIPFESGSMVSATSSSGEVDATGADSTPGMDEDITPSVFSTLLLLASTARTESFGSTFGRQHPGRRQGRLDNASALPCRVPGRCWILKLNSCRRSSRRGCPMMSGVSCN